MPNISIPLMLNFRGSEVKDLHASLTRLGVRLPKHEVANELFGAGTEDVLKRLQAKHHLPATGVFDEATSRALDGAIAMVTTQPRVEGRLYFRTGAPATGVALRLYHEEFGGGTQRLADGQSDATGYYSLQYDAAPRKASNIVVRAVDAKASEIALSAVKYNTGSYLRLNLLVPAAVKGAKPEYERLIARLETLGGGIAGLARAREDAERRDITLLHRSTGWDARLIALAAFSAKLGAEANIEPEALYAAFRAGLPADRQRLVLFDSALLDKAITKARKAGITALSGKRRAAALKAFDEFVARNRKELKKPGALSTLRQMLDASPLRSEAKRDEFEQLYFGHRGTAAEFWAKARATFEAEEVEGLRLQGKLGFLTLNNALLAQALRRDLGMTGPGDLVELADRGYYKQDKWLEALRTLANTEGKQLVDLVPPAYRSGTEAERLESYTADLARMVRSRHPVKVLARRIENDELQLGDKHAEVKDHVLDFLENAGKLGLRFGRMPLGVFLRRYEKEPEKLFAQPIKDQSRRKAIIEATERLRRTPLLAFARQTGAKLLWRRDRKIEPALIRGVQQLRRMPVGLFVDDKPFRNRRARDLVKTGGVLGALRKRFTEALQEEIKRLPAMIEEQHRKEIVDAVKTLHRLYQITPSDEALQVLYDLGLQSARDVAAMGQEDFITRFVAAARRRAKGAKDSGYAQRIRQEALRVYRKAAQVQAVVLNVVGAAAQLDGTRPLYVVSGLQGEGG